MATAVIERAKTALPWKRCWLEGAGTAILFSPGILWSQLSPIHEDAFHRLMPQNTITRALAVDLLLLSIFGMLLAIGIEALVRWEAGEGRRSRRPLAPLLWAVWLGLLAAEGTAGLMFAQLARWRGVSDVRAFLAVSELLLLLWIFSPLWYRRCVRFLRYGLMLLGLCIFWMLPVLLAHSLEHQPWDHVRFSKPVPPTAAQHRRIVWLLFDGMSYDQMFDHRRPDLMVPNFDKLHQVSVTFSNMGPGGSYTENVIPSVFLGKLIAHVQATTAGSLNFQQNGGDWEPFEEDETLFADAKHQGWTTGVAGWFNPYCRMLQSQLDFCSMLLPPFPSHFSRNNSTFRNVLAPVIGNWTYPPPATPKSRDLLDQLEFIAPDEALINDSSINLAFVHLPIPHAPNRYNRRTARLEPNGSYLDNLALSDLVLGRFLKDIQTSAAADRTTLIVSSDHGWRVWMWRRQIGWTPEDEVASGGGKFDDRPMLMVSFPGEQHSAVIGRRIPLLNMHGMIEDMLAGHIESREQLEDWAVQQ